MPLDPSIFMQYAQLKAQQNAQTLGQLTNAVNSYREQKRYDKQYALEEQKVKNQGLDLKKLATPALIKMQMGEQLTPQDQAVLKAWDLTETRKLAPDATGNYRKVNASIFGGEAPQGFDLGTIAPVPPVSREPFPDSFAGGVADIGNMGMPASAPAPNDKPLSMADLQGIIPPMDVSQMNAPAVSDAQFEAMSPKGFDLNTVSPQYAPIASVVQERAPITVPPELANNPNAAQKYLEAAAAAEVDVGKAGAVETAKLRAEKAASKPKAEAKLIDAAEKSGNIDQTINDAIKMITPQTAGMGSAIKDIPIIGKGSKSKDLASLLDTISADSAFSELQTMRDNSQTGGALGSITERELALLQNAAAALNQDQSPAQLKSNLQKYQDIRRRALERSYAAFEKENGYRPQGQATTPQTGAKSWQEYF